jgi:CHAT domain
VHAPVPRIEQMRVLMITANPVDSTANAVDSTLWIDREIRDAQRAIERAKHRDRLDIIIRPAAQRDDLLEQLNLHTPHVLHFSGHGSHSGIYLETDDRETDQLLTGELLARVIGSLDSPPRVIVLNACDTQVMADLLAGRGVEAVIAMSQPISDTAARLFTEQLYSAIASGQSLRSAFDQAVLKLAFADLDEEDTPVLSCAEGIDAAKLILIEP